ncbi:MAG: transposase [Holosporales bacterium]
MRLHSYFRGTCNTEVFNTWIEQQLLPILDDKSLVIMDNAVFHKSQKTKDLIESVGAKLLFLPPYSPDLNPIEKNSALLNDSGNTMLISPLMTS